jgi:hypothetical protein
MKVYCVFEVFLHEGNDLVFVGSTQEKADKYVKDHESEMTKSHWFTIEDWDVK